jgi:hypothetical protein
MSAPSVAIDPHHRYTSELRDRVLGKLRASMQAVDESAYRMLTPAHLRALAELHSPQAPVLSLYLQLSPDRRATGSWRTHFKDLAAALIKPIAERHKREAVKDELDRIEAALEAGLPAFGRGVAFFVCRPPGFWRQIAVSVPLPDGAYLRPRPFIRPLVRTRDEHDRFVLALLSLQRSRFFISQIGQVEEVLDVEGERVPRKYVDSAAREHGGVHAPEPMKIEARVLADVAELVLAQFEGRHLLMSGAPELRSAVAHGLPKHAQERIGGDFAVEVHAGPAAVAAAAKPAQKAVEEREETATIQRLIDAAPGAAVWGVGPVLDALRQQRVMLLAVDDAFGVPGARCDNCAALLDEVMRACPVCGSDAIRAVEEVVELAIEQALEQRSALELVRSGAARRLMNARAPLRW